MALSGSFYTNWSGYAPSDSSQTQARFLFNWTGTQNIASNSTTISWSLTAYVKNAYSDPAGSGYGRGVRKAVITAGDTPVYTEVWPSSSMRKVINGTVLSSGSFTINHDSDGTKSVNINAKINVGYDNENTFNSTGNASYTLNVIPRASDVSIQESYTATSSSGNLPFKITPKVTTFYHVVTWTIDNATATTVVNGSNIATEITYNITRANILAKLTTSQTGNLVVTCKTYNSSTISDANLIGTKTATCRITIDATTIKPTGSLGTPTYSTTPIANYAVAGYTKLSVVWSGKASTSASIASISLKLVNATTTSTVYLDTVLKTSGTEYNNQTFTMPDFLLSSSANYTVKFILTVTDTRGISLTVTGSNVTVYGYQLPIVTLNAYRTTTSSSTNEDGSGLYAYVTFTSQVGSSINNQNSIQSANCTYTGDVSGTVSNGGHFALADNQTVKFTLTVSDKVSSVTVYDDISTAIYPLDLVDDSRGHVGVGFGITAEEDYTKTGLATKGFFLYGTCATARATARKVVSDIPQFNSTYMVAGTVVFIKFTNANGVANPTLSINGTTAKSIKRYGTTAPSTSAASSWMAGSVVCLVYDGTYWQQLGYLNTTYSEISINDITNTTGSSAGLISGRRFKSAFDTNMATYISNHTDIVWCKDTTNSGIGAGTGTVPSKVIKKQIGNAFSISAGNVVCGLAGIVRVRAKIWTYCATSNGGGRDFYIRQNGVNNEDTKLTTSWWSNDCAYLEAILDVAANDVLNVYVYNQSGSGRGIQVMTTSSFVVEYISYS